jgi:hypothetical protein
MSTPTKTSKTFEQKMTKDGKINPKYVDLLSEDPPITNQQYGCYSFVSPEKIIKQKDIFMFEKFVKQWQYAKSLNMFSDFMQFISHKYTIDPEKLMADFVEFVTEEENVLKREDVTSDYNHFMDKNEVRLTEEFQKQHDFQTSVRGFINRGNFATSDEAEKFAKQIRDRDPNHDIFVGRNFVWTPLDPDAYKTGRIEFMEEELNQLHHEKLKNEMKAKEEFEKRLYESKRKAIERNIEEAKKSGNKLTQTMDADGNLIGVKETVDFDSREVAMDGGDPIRTRQPFQDDTKSPRVEELESIKEDENV